MNKSNQLCPEKKNITQHRPGIGFSRFAAKTVSTTNLITWTLREDNETFQNLNRSDYLLKEKGNKEIYGSLFDKEDTFPFLNALQMK